MFLFTSAPLLGELRGVLGREKFSKQLEARGLSAEEVFDGYAALATMVTPAIISPTIASDSTDDVVLATALAAQADAIVSGDAHLLNLKDYQGIPEVFCLPSQINQVFMNLLINAGQAIAERGTITLRTGAAEGEVWVSIEDTGGGIRPDDLKRIFEPFFTTKPVGQGTGLGLSLAYGIIGRHNGRIEANSELGRGTVFRVTLPINRNAPLSTGAATLSAAHKEPSAG